MKSKLPIDWKELTIKLDDATYKTLVSIATKRYEEPPEELAADLLDWAITGLAGTIIYKVINGEDDEENND